jgi:uncharacterized integral membrane protein
MCGCGNAAAVDADLPIDSEVAAPLIGLAFGAIVVGIIMFAITEGNSKLAGRGGLF